MGAEQERRRQVRVLVFDYGSIPSVPNLKLVWDGERVGYDWPNGRAYRAVWLCDCSECGAEYETTSWRETVCSEDCRIVRRRRLAAVRSRRYRDCHRDGQT